jgi:hypothetical protein
MRAKNLFLVACALMLSAHLCNIGCSGESPQPSVSAPSTSPALSATSRTSDAAASPAASPNAPAVTADAAPTDAAPKGDVKIMKEYWEGTKNLKFWNEMRRDENGRWDRNGIGRAYYAGGKLEREGMYRNGKRVGVWTYYDIDGKVLRTENRGDGAAAEDEKPQP